MTPTGRPQTAARDDTALVVVRLTGTAAERPDAEQPVMFSEPGRTAGLRAGVAQVLVHERDRHAALADRGRDALHGREPDVAAGEDAGHARLQEVGVALQRPPSRRGDVRAGEDEAVR